MEAKEKGNKLIVVLLIITMLLVLAMAGYFGYFILYKNKNSTSSNEPTKKVLNEKTVQLEEFIIRLADPEKSYIKFKISLAYTDKKTEKEITNKISQIRDAINMHLMTKESSELDYKGLEKLKAELKVKLNKIIENGEITNIYLYEIITQ